MSIRTQDFRTKTVYKPTKNISVDGKWPIGLDIGYSGVKGFSPNAIFAFPSFAKNLGKNPTFYGEPDEDEILYRDDETKEIWRVGRNAEKMISERDTSNSQLELYGRDRYYTQMYTVIARAGIALGCLNNECGDYIADNEIVIQTGLPPAYKEADTGAITDVFADNHKFSIKTGRTRGYVSFNLNIERKNVRVMSQPEGTLMSIALDNNAKSLKGANRYFTSNIIFFDAGFGTFDLFDITSGTVHSKESFSDFGMRAVLEECCKKIYEEKGVVVRPQVMQNILERGEITIQKRGRGTFASHTEPIADALEAASNEVCKRAVNKVIDTYAGLIDYKYLVLTGGTAAAWLDELKETFSQVQHLTIIPGNINCPDLDMIFCNVRGYYLYVVSALDREAKVHKQVHH